MNSTAELLTVLDLIAQDERIARYKGTEMEAWAITGAFNLYAPRLNAALLAAVKERS